jgi:hypothetical protein
MASASRGCPAKDCGFRSRLLKNERGKIARQRKIDIMTRCKFLSLPICSTLGLICAFVGGCQTTTIRSGAAPAVSVSNSPGAQQPAPFTGDALDALDPCGNRIEDLCGPLALYYRDNHHGPARIEELERYAFAGEHLNLVCPVSNKPYLCSPQGLEARGQEIHIFIYDAEPVHNGARWCAVARGGAVLNQPQIMYAVKMSEAVFRRFQASPLVLPIQ